MTEEQKQKMQEALKERTENRTVMTFDKITIKSYEAGWMLLIGSEDTRYYSDLTGLFKKLFSIKLSRKHMDTLQQIEASQKDCLREVKEIAEKLEIAINKQGEKNGKRNHGKNQNVLC